MLPILFDLNLIYLPGPYNCKVSPTLWLLVRKYTRGWGDSGNGVLWGTIIFLQLPLLSAKQIHIYWFSKVLAVKTNSKALRTWRNAWRIPPQSFHTATKMTACPSVPTAGLPCPQVGVIWVWVQRKINLLLLVQQLHQFWVEMYKLQVLTQVPNNTY